MRLLVAEGDPALGVFLQRGFDAEHYAVDLTANGEEAKALAQERNYDTAILDLNLPRAGDFELLRSVRAGREELPIVILTNRTRPEDRARVFELGADDLVLKPFAFSELSARVRALLRRGRTGDAVLRVDDLVVSRIEHSVQRAGRKIELTSKEFALLEYLMRHAGQCMTRASIVENVWHASRDSVTNVVDVYVNYLRKKVDASSERKLIQTVRGVGYLVRGGAASSSNKA